MTQKADTMIQKNEINNFMNITQTTLACKLRFNALSAKIRFNICSDGTIINYLTNYVGYSSTSCFIHTSTFPVTVP